MTSISSFDEALAFIWDRSGYDRGFISNPFAGDDAARLGLIRTERVLDLLGRPDRDYPIVHVAGSKGKGSTCSFIDSMLRAAGIKTGRFLSPHMHSYRERFVVNDLPISEDDFTTLVADVMDATTTVESDYPAIGQLTAWELSTAMALLWFSRSGCRVAVIEVGLGGTLDATNVVDPAVSVISRLDFEHTAILGTTMSEIAGNKAGIIKPGKPVVSAVQPFDGMTVIEARAAQLGSSLQVAGRDWFVSGSDASFSVTGPDWRYDRLTSSLVGQHQVDNAGLAIAALQILAKSVQLPTSIDEDTIRRGLASTFIPGRFEVVEHASGATVVIDGAHSPESTKALANAIRSHYQNTLATVVAGMLSDKHPDTVLPPLESVADQWIVTPLESPRTLSVEPIVAHLESRGFAVKVAESIAHALEIALAQWTLNPENRLIVVTGSLTAAAEARVALGLA